MPKASYAGGFFFFKSCQASFSKAISLFCRLFKFMPGMVAKANFNVYIGSHVYRVG